VLQEVALAGLWRRGFFDKAAFYGGTALRLFHGLDRFSEDLDFSLIKTDPLWKLEDRLDGLREEIEAFGFSVEIEAKSRAQVESAFIKANTKINLVSIEAPIEMSKGVEPNRLVKVKLEVDTDPPAPLPTEVKTLLEPFPVSVRLATLPALFAGKLHACICRSWQSRVKGRDWDDFLFFVSRGMTPDLNQLEARLRQSGHWNGEASLSGREAHSILDKRIAEIDWKKARDDAAPFVRDPRSLELWGKDLFTEAAEKIVWA
jgi:predicted nucleotidyltransferase component of viral defense system